MLRKGIVIFAAILLLQSCSGGPDEQPVPPEQELLSGIEKSKNHKDWNNVYLLCKQLLNNYPASNRYEEIKLLQFKACKQFVIEGEHKSFLIIPYTVRRRPIDNLLDTTRSYPYEPYTAGYIYWFGTFLLELGYNTTADLQFQKIVDRYADSEYIDDSLFQLGNINLKRFDSPEYSVEYLEKAETYFNRIVDEHPDSTYLGKSKALLGKIHEVLSNKTLTTALFYENRDNPKGAIIYYTEILLKYPNTKAAGISKKALQRLGEKNNNTSNGQDSPPEKQ